MEDNILIIVCIIAASFTGIITGGTVSYIISKKRTFRHINKLIKKTGKIKNYSGVAETIATQIDENKEEHSKMVRAIDILNWERKKNIKKIGYVRYDSNPNISGNMSFSLAMLNEKNTGVILTNIHMMEGSSIYLREIKEGKCDITLSEEEKEALRNTINK